MQSVAAFRSYSRYHAQTDALTDNTTKRTETPRNTREHRERTLTDSVTIRSGTIQAPVAEILDLLLANLHPPPALQRRGRLENIKISQQAAMHMEFCKNKDSTV